MFPVRISTLTLGLLQVLIPEYYEGLRLGVNDTLSFALYDNSRQSL